MVGSYSLMWPNTSDVSDERLSVFDGSERKDSSQQHNSRAVPV